MNPTVITTGPGVIIATATTSINCCSVSQWCSNTVPPWRKGTIARQLPNTNKADLVKKNRICRNNDGGALTPTPVSSMQLTVARENLGRAFTIRNSSPPARKSQTISCSLNAVETSSASGSNHVGRLDRLVRSGVDHGHDVELLQVDVDEFCHRIILRHAGFALEIESGNDLVILDIDYDLRLRPLIGDVQLMERRSVCAAVGFLLRRQLGDDLALAQVNYFNFLFMPV